MTNPFKLLIFDLDGTLIDSRRDLCNSVNATLAHLGKPALPVSVIATYIGDGASMLIRRALGDPEGDSRDEQYLSEALTYFLDYYRVHKLDCTTLYPGVIQSLEALRHDNCRLLMAVLTNKPVRPSRDICAHFGLDRFFFQNYGGNSFHTKKPDPTGLRTLVAEAGQLLGEPVSHEATLMIGDSATDILTAHNAGVRSLGCTYGLAPDTLASAKPDAFCHSAADWPSSLALFA